AFTPRVVLGWRGRVVPVAVNDHSEAPRPGALHADDGTKTSPRMSRRAVRSRADRVTTGPPSPFFTSMVTVKKPVGCSTSMSIEPSVLSGMTATSCATDPGSTHAVATDTAPRTPIASCTRRGMNVRVDTVPPCAGGDSRLIFGTVLLVT